MLNFCYKMEKLFLYCATICVLLSIINLPITQGLDCFHCVYVKEFPIDTGIPGHPKTDKCEKKVPDEYKKPCTYPLLPANFGHLGNVSSPNDNILNEEDTCVKIHAKWTGSEIVFRSCVPKNWVTAIDASKLGACTSGNLQELADHYNVTLGIDGRPIHIEAACFCDGDGCNSASKTGGNVAIFGILFSFFLARF